MAEEYNSAEMMDMLLVYGYCEGNGRESVRVYSERFPNGRIPNHQTFAAIERRLRETGSFTPVTANYGRQREVRTPAIEEQILERITEDPKLSTRRLGLEIGVSKDVIHRTLKDQQLHPYHIQKVQDLLPPDLDQRLGFCRFITEQRQQNMDFAKQILFTDEACFTRSGITNLHNEHVYADENPHATKVTHYQHDFRINLWAGIIGDFIIGPVILPPRLNGVNYLEYLQNTLPDLLEDLPLQLRRVMWFMHDGAPPHFTLNVRNYLNQQFPNKWIGRGNDAPVNWPPRSPNMTPLDYFLWGTLKLHNEHVYADENPHATKVTHYQHDFRINLWAGIIGDFIIGPVILPPRLNGVNYLEYLQNTLPDLLEDLPLQLRRVMWFMHDSAPPHFTLNVRNYLNQQFPNKWIGRGNDAPVNWPPRSPNMTPLDYFYGGP